jgi:O-antigen/teichoic acid export membrane protein
MRLLFRREGFRRYFTNTSWLLAEKILRLTVGLFISIWIARYLGPEKFGLLSFAESFVAIFTAVMALGLNSIVVRELVTGKLQQNTVLGTSFALRAIGAACMLACIVVIVNTADYDALTRQIIIILGLAASFKFYEVIDFYFQAKVLAKYSAISNACALLLSAAVKIFLIYIQAPLVWFAYVFLVESFLLSVFYLYFFTRTGNSVRSMRFKWDIGKTLLADSWPLIFSGIVISVYMKIDQVMIQEYLGSWHVGQYAAGVRLCDAWLFITVIITNSLFPAIVTAKSQSDALFRERMIALYKFLILIAVSISVVTSILSEHLIAWTFGDNYEPAATVLQLYIWSIIFVFMNNASWKWYTAENLQQIAMLRLSLGAVANIALNMIFIPQYGIEGAAYATLISYVLATYLGNALHPKTFTNFKMQTYSLLTFYSFKAKAW